MANSSSVGMFDIPNFLGGSSLLANQGLRSSGLGGSSGSLVADPFGGGGPQAREVGAPGTGIDPVPVDDTNACLHSIAVTGNPTPCPPNQSHQPAPCGPCQVMGSPGEIPSGLIGPDVPLEETPQPSSCPEPTSPMPGKPGSHTWNTATCTWDPREGVSPTRGEVPLTAGQMIAGDIMGGSMQYGRGRGAQSRQELGLFGRTGGGIGGGAMGDMELFENPLLAGGSPYLEKNVSQFAGGGRMKNPYKYADGGRADFMSGVRKGMNSAVAAGQIQRVVRNNRASRRFTSGGKF
jgi:hypothetical protein